MQGRGDRLLMKSLQHLMTATSLWIELSRQPWIKSPVMLRKHYTHTHTHTQKRNLSNVYLGSNTPGLSFRPIHGEFGYQWHEGTDKHCHNKVSVDIFMTNGLYTKDSWARLLILDAVDLHVWFLVDLFHFEPCWCVLEVVKKNLVSGENQVWLLQADVCMWLQTFIEQEVCYHWHMLVHYNRDTNPVIAIIGTALLLPHLLFYLKDCSNLARVYQNWHHPELMPMMQTGTVSAPLYCCQHQPPMGGFEVVDLHCSSWWRRLNPRGQHKCLRSTFPNIAPGISAPAVTADLLVSACTGDRKLMSSLQETQQGVEACTRAYRWDDERGW